MKNTRTTSKHTDTIRGWAKIFGLHHDTLLKYLVKAGFEKPKPNGKIPIQQVIAATKESDLKAEQTRETRERADKLALANAREREDLVPMSEVEEIMFRMFNPVAEMLQNLPTDLMHQANPADPDHAESAMREYVRHMMPRIRDGAAFLTNKRKAADAD